MPTVSACLRSSQLQLLQLVEMLRVVAHNLDRRNVDPKSSVISPIPRIGINLGLDPLYSRSIILDVLGI